MEGSVELAEINLKTLFVTSKIQWHGDLSKQREVELTLKAIENALQGLLKQVSSCCKENEKQTKKLQKRLTEVAGHLSVSSEEQRSSDEKGKLFQKYNQLLADSKINAKKTSEQLAMFESIRNGVVSMDIKTSDGKKLAAPLFDAALLNFPSEGLGEQETKLLTSLSFLILLATQKEQWNMAVAVAQTVATPSEPAKTPKKQTKAEVPSKEGTQVKNTGEKKSDKAAAGKSKGKTEGDSKLKSTGGKEPEFKTPTEPTIKGGKGAPPKASEQKQASKTDKAASVGSCNKPTKQMKVQHIDAPSKAEDFVPQLDTKERNAFHALLPPSILPLPTLPPSSLPHTVYNTAPERPLKQSLHNKKAFLVLAVNGKQYGKIVFEIRPDVAPVMCKKFVQCCLSQEGLSYQGTVINESKPKTSIMGRRVLGQESLYMADESPLKKTRGAISFQLKRDYALVQCNIVSTDFTIHLDDEKSENHRISTVFGYVCDGLAVCDAISHIDCEKDHIAVCSAGLE
ncbi:hypothetical protein OUZ56_016150 [Daphnia magna]|uniref:PPIase cyclophilin-type domain-containing protein n=1 Tax=Daphnia magna TaxID=35525 RepID=A0ABR0APT2_9CRUS|nr:hypothetical protein OUZ56_016150 [Daphnia magna]